MPTTRIQLRRDTAANWTSTNPALYSGEQGYETDTGKLKIGDGSTAWNSLGYFAGGGSGSLLELQVVRVDASGDDGTGTIGDLGNPFLTVQAAIDAITAISPGDGSNYVIDIGNNNFFEDLTTTLAYLQFMGRGVNQGYTSGAFRTLAMTVTGNPFIMLDACYASNDITITSSGAATVQLSRWAFTQNISQTGTGGLFITGDLSGDFGVVDLSITSASATLSAEHVLWGGSMTTGGGPIRLKGYTSFATLNAAGGDITIANCIFPRVYTSGPPPFLSGVYVNSTGSTVWAFNAIVNDVTNVTTLNLVDSRIIGTNLATTTVYKDSFLAVLSLHTLAAPPSSPTEGQIYADSVTHHLYYYNGTTWKQLDN